MLTSRRLRLRSLAHCVVVTLSCVWARRRDKHRVGEERRREFVHKVGKPFRAITFVLLRFADAAASFYFLLLLSHVPQALVHSELVALSDCPQLFAVRSERRRIFQQTMEQRADKVDRHNHNGCREQDSCGDSETRHYGRFFVDR